MAELSVPALHYWPVCACHVRRDNGVNINNITANSVVLRVCVHVCVHVCVCVKASTSGEQLSTGSALNCCRPIKSCLSCSRGYEGVSR